jgi:hypothetical protein
MEAALFPLFMVVVGMVGVVIGLLTMGRDFGAPALDWPWPSLPS